jgi:succinate dehydrogenase / fumarate reductase membrane anchor subunit
MQKTLDSEARAATGLGNLTWVWQAVTGIALLALLGLHFIAHHFVVEGGLRNFQQVQEYIGNPIILTLEVLFLVVVTPHALLGVRAILFDLQLSEATEKWIDRVLWVIGIATVLYGFWLTWAIVTYPAS